MLMGFLLRLLKNSLITMSFWEAHNLFIATTGYSFSVIREMKHSFKANLTLVKKHWQHKVLGRQVSIKDGLEPRFSNDMTIWIPKFTPKYPEPSMFFHLANRNSSAYFRTKPFVLTNSLQQLINTITSDKWMDTWERMKENSERLITDNLFLDEEYFDMPLFEKDNKARI
jgi:hypothetical protein